LLKMKNPKNLEIHALPGQRLPRDWQQQAAARAAAADANYAQHMQNAWRQPIAGGASVQKLAAMGITSLNKGPLPPINV
jgi:hypothetical protein